MYQFMQITIFLYELNKLKDNTCSLRDLECDQEGITIFLL